MVVLNWKKLLDIFAKFEDTNLSIYRVAVTSKTNFIEVRSSKKVIPVCVSHVVIIEEQVPYFFFLILPLESPWEENDSSVVIISCNRIKVEFHILIVNELVGVQVASI